MPKTRTRTRTRTNKKTNKRMRGGNPFDSVAANGVQGMFANNGLPSGAHGWNNSTGFGDRSLNRQQFAALSPLRGPSDSPFDLKGDPGKAYYASQPLKGGRRHRKGLSRKSAKKVKKCVKKASRKKSAKARRSGTRKCMKLKKRLSKH